LRNDPGKLDTTRVQARKEAEEQLKLKGNGEGTNHNIHAETD